LEFIVRPVMKILGGSPATIVYTETRALPPVVSSRGHVTEWCHRKRYCMRQMNSAAARIGQAPVRYRSTATLIVVRRLRRRETSSVEYC